MTSRILALLLVWAVSGCEPCAVVVGGHCQDRQHEEENDEATRPRTEQPPPQPYYLPRPHARG